MGVTRQIARVILKEHIHRPITGRILLIGRQTIFLQPDELYQLLQEENIPLRREAALELDTKTAHGIGKGYVSDKSFFESFCDARVDAVDVSDYEGATIIANLNAEIPTELKGRFDFIFNGSCLDNIFDGANALRRISEMMSSDGRVIHFERCSYYYGVYLAYSPEWFYDYYAANDFADCQAYYIVRPGAGGIIENGETWELYRYFPPHATPPVQSNAISPWGIPLNLHTLVIAERKASSTTSRFPIQRFYRPPEVRDSLPQPFAQSPRAHIGSPTPYALQRHWHHAGFLRG